MAKLIGANLSPFVRKVRIALAEKGLEVESEQVVPFGMSDEMKKKSPLGKIPVYEDGDLIIPDSSVIIDYLENTHPEPALYPKAAGSRARALFLEEHADTRLVEALATVFFQRFVRPNFFKEKADEALVKEALETKVPVAFDYLEEQLGDDEYLVDNTFGIADVATSSPFVNFAIAGERVDAGRWPKLAAYVDRCWARPACKSIVEGDLPS